MMASFSQDSTLVFHLDPLGLHGVCPEGWTVSTVKNFGVQVLSKSTWGGMGFIWVTQLGSTAIYPMKPAAHASIGFIARQDEGTSPPLVKGKGAAHYRPNLGKALGSERPGSKTEQPSILSSLRSEVGR